jgi:hypothetical protein
MRPDIFCPRNTRDGVAEAPIEPGARTLCEPWLTGPRLKLCRLIVPAKPLPTEVPGDLDLVAGLEGLDGDRVADVELGVAAELGEVTVGGRAGLLQMAELALRDLAVDHRLVGELHGGVAVGCLAANVGDGARTGLDHGDRGDAARLRIEDLGHAELSAKDAFHHVT